MTADDFTRMRDLGVNQILQDGVHLEIGGVFVQHQALPGTKREGA